jgi:hypothetical protein
VFELKPLTRAGIERALTKVERARLLNDPWTAESICRDILDVEPHHQEALISLLLSLTDRFRGWGGARASVEEARSLLPRLESPYDRAYYAGIICERKGTATLRRNVEGTGPIAHRWLTEGMKHYEEAEALRPEGNDDALVRWNACARLIMLNPRVRPAAEIEEESLLE